MDESGYATAVSIIRAHADGCAVEHPGGDDQPRIELAVLRIAATLAVSTGVEVAFVEAISRSSDAQLLDSVLGVTSQILCAAAEENVPVDDWFESIPSGLAFRDIAVNEHRRN